MTHAPGAEARMVAHAVIWADILRPLSSLARAERILADLGGHFAASEELHAEDVETLAGALLAVAGIIHDEQEERS
jgi:hypothetical protein